MPLSKLFNSITFIVGILFFSGFFAEATDNLTIVKAENVQWSALNPLRGDNSPQAGNLWGNREQNGVSGFLVKFRDGFSSPPHIHNVGYRGVVISGEIHNDDPKAANLWMSSGSFWTQPAGESHITSAKGKYNVVYVEIDSGPYLVWPAIKAFDDGERPVNIEARNIVWQSTDEIKNMLLNKGNTSRSVPEISYLWGQPGKGSEYGLMLRIPAMDNSVLLTLDRNFRGVIVSGELEIPGKIKHKLTPGSYFGSDSGKHITLDSKQMASIIYIKTDGELHLNL